MTTHESALKLSQRGFYVFPLVRDEKKPPFKGRYVEYATRDSKQIELWWKTEASKQYGIGIATEIYDHPTLGRKALVVVDIDKDTEKDGFAVLKKLKDEGKLLSKTYTQKSKRGFHFFYWTDKVITQGAAIFGAGFDIRSYGGLCVGAGSTINGHTYTVLGTLGVQQCPEWVIEGREKTEQVDVQKTVEAVESDDKRILSYIEHSAPKAEHGNINDTAYRVACRILDFGTCAIDELASYLSLWNDKKCDPPMVWADVYHQALSAYNYRTRPQAIDAPENRFEEIKDDSKPEDPILKYNQKFAFALEGGKSVILHETKDDFGKFFLDRISVPSFHERFAPDTTLQNERAVPTSKLWMRHPGRRTFDRVAFLPGLVTDEKVYNLWQGFNEEPTRVDEKPTQQMVDALESFKEHLHENVCTKDKNLSNWLLGYFAHLVQRPWEKPLVALVFRGRKGVGKNTPVELVGHLVERHFIVASKSQHVLGNFNAHMEHCLLVALSEAFWSGDKKAEGVLKELITGDRHLIERKGKDVIVARNYARIVIMSNEDWVVPATTEERRFAAFDVGSGRMQDLHFFKTMKKNMKEGGFRYLLRYFLDYDLKGLDVNQAPKTDALHNQILESLSPVQRWWRQCLLDGGICGAPMYEHAWPAEMPCKEFRNAFYRDAKETGVKSWLPSPSAFAKELATYVHLDSIRKQLENERHRYYKLPGLKECRALWDEKIGGKDEWEEFEEDLSEVL